MFSCVASICFCIYTFPKKTTCDCSRRWENITPHTIQVSCTNTSFVITICRHNFGFMLFTRISITFKFPFDFFTCSFFKFFYIGVTFTRSPVSLFFSILSFSLSFIFVTSQSLGFLIDFISYFSTFFYQTSNLLPLFPFLFL
ncbi:hypothetical protein Hanom_Chr12g01139301 [Helianthus anomalus]